MDKNKVKKQLVRISEQTLNGKASKITVEPELNFKKFDENSNKNQQKTKIVSAKIRKKTVDLTKPNLNTLRKVQEQIKSISLNDDISNKEPDITELIFGNEKKISKLLNTSPTSVIFRGLPSWDRDFCEHMHQINTKPTNKVLKTASISIIKPELKNFQKEYEPKQYRSKIDLQKLQPKMSGSKRYYDGKKLFSLTKLWEEPFI